MKNKTIKDVGVLTQVSEAKRIFLNGFKSNIGFSPKASQVTIDSITKNEDNSEHIVADISGVKWCFNVIRITQIDAIQQVRPTEEVTDSNE